MPYSLLSRVVYRLPGSVTLTFSSVTFVHAYNAGEKQLWLLRIHSIPSIPFPDSIPSLKFAVGPGLIRFSRSWVLFSHISRQTRDLKVMRKGHQWNNNIGSEALLKLQ